MSGIPPLSASFWGSSGGMLQSLLPVLPQ